VGPIHGSLRKRKKYGSRPTPNVEEESFAMVQSCQFCRIIAGKIPASIVYEDDYALAFLDNRPASEGHTLVIPKKHYETIYDIPDGEITPLFTVVKKMALALRKTVNPEGLTIAQRNGAAAGQHVPHLHVHLIPRYGSQRLLRMQGIQEASQQELDKTAKTIRQHF
jgi:histidine triad (HIT) family protein